MPGAWHHPMWSIRRVAGSSLVLVTPGMVEFRPRQAGANRELANAAREVVTNLVVVGRTNRRALVAGAGRPPRT